jgi:RNA polymerase sigma factor (sigma-70 family)
VATSPNPRSFVERLFAEHRRSLQAFFYRRIRTKADASDLAQEVYLRMLRVPDPKAILRPELYLFTVASNLVKEHGVLEGRRAHQVDADSPAVQAQLEETVEFDGHLDHRRQAQRLRAVLAQLSPKCRAAVVLQYRDGLSYQEIGTRLGVSSHMVKKYLAQGLAHCRRRMARYG